MRSDRVKLHFHVLLVLQTAEGLAVAEARAYFNKDQAARLWAASHAGVYVPVSLATQPNPFLSHVPERDIYSPSGRPLTLMNPAYMIRQMMEHYNSLHNVRGRITGLRYFREETAPDAWESRTLLSFAARRDEVIEFTDMGANPTCD